MTTTRHRKTADERRLEVIAAAIHEFATLGFEGGSTERIAVDAGISQPYVLRLFGSKIGLFLAALDSVCDDVIAAWQRTNAALLADLPPQQRLLALGDAYRQGTVSPDAFRLILQGATASHIPDIRAHVNAGMDRIHAWVSAETGASYDEIQRFWAAGMMITIAHAMHATDLVATSERARLMLMLPETPAVPN